MRFLVGLGNPGRRYARTRHNVGFRVIDRLLSGRGAGAPRSMFRAEVWRVEDEAPLILVKPQTFMNDSGASVRDVLGYYRGTPGDLLVIYDDLDLPIGTLRFRRAGSSGGHRGAASIIACLGTTEFARLKIGIGRTSDGADPVDHVLGTAKADEADAMLRAESRAAAAAADWVRRGLDWCMNAYNRADDPDD
ncbi:MAG: aminoacyl-tRNA hydrolase [Planctomycetes bacterium]|nr:aminoacyl-tRNA hydrolase [Planctomycetota bacterium]